MKNATSPLFRNHNRSALEAGTYITHRVIYYPLVSLCSQPEPQKKMKINKPSKKRKESDRKFDSLNFDLAQEGWDSVLNETDANRAYDIFIKKITFYFNKKYLL